MIRARGRGACCDPALLTLREGQNSAGQGAQTATSREVSPAQLHLPGGATRLRVVVNEREPESGI